MKAIGIVREIDRLGRIVIPIELRRTMDMNVGDPLEFYTEGDKIIMRKYQPACIFCGSADEISTYKGKKICGKCRMELKT